MPEATFDGIVCSEVLEHIEDDLQALGELSRVLTAGGHLLLTVPVRRRYFARDDQVAGHFRRYEVEPLLASLRQVGLEPVRLAKVAGPLEKWIMPLVIQLGQLINGRLGSQLAHSWVWKMSSPIIRGCNLCLSYVIAWDAWLWPLSHATIVLVHAQKPLKVREGFIRHIRQ